jgi:hypothetical protein
MQAASGNPARDRISADPTVQELAMVDRAPLSRRDPGDMGGPDGERTLSDANVVL